METATPDRLVLGGHSFIEQLGNDPEASFDEQCRIVRACLDAGVRRIDTTYYQERVALGRVLAHLGRRDEAYIQAWNFFQQPGQEKDLVGPTPYEPHHLRTLRDELQSDWVDLLIVHVHEDLERLRRELPCPTLVYLRKPGRPYTRPGKSRGSRFLGWARPRDATGRPSCGSRV
jgi:aryl-alcohol dehydrogenase-like predicted oxidoreductase